jgi:ABC-type Na+ efflux pump permease subunit
MNRIVLVARREFLTTVRRKGFLIGVFLMPLLVFVALTLVPGLANSRALQASGEIVIVDPTQAVRRPLELALQPEAIAARREAVRSRAQRNNPIAANVPIAQVPQFTVVAAPSLGDVDAAKRWLAEPDTRGRRIAVIAIAPDAVQRRSGEAEFGGYELFLRGTLDNATENVLHTSARQALLQARLSTYGIASGDVDATLFVARPEAVLVARNGEQAGNRGFNSLLPFVMGFLMFMGVVMGGQSLMTSTIEEKSSRVVEVLLSAVSPLELMWGKLIGQLGVSLLVLAIYIGLGLMGLLQFALFGLLDPALILWLFVFFVVTYLVFGAVMLAIGAAVSQVADAQALMGPVMLLLALPYMLLPVVAVAPNSSFSVTLSLLPPVNTFVMLARLASTAPPPLWQALLSLGFSMLAAAAAVWFAAKVFRVGLLLNGKPPSFATLLRWARMA